MRVPSDERLAQRAAQGDRAAFEAIYRRYHQPLYRFCLAMVGNPADAQDALQNTMVKALRALPGERRLIRLRPWLYRIARNESVELLRRRREPGELDAALEATGGVAETAEARAKLRDLLGDLEQLPERQRAVLVMRELSGFSFAEIGESLQTSAAVARQTLYEARLSLRQLEAGREMPCADVMRELSDADGRVSRRREIRAHLRNCADCRAFRESIGRRRSEISAIAPLPLAASAGVLQTIFGSQASAAGAAAGAGGAGAAGVAVASSTIVKSAATVAVATVIGVSAADRGGLVDLPLPDGGHSKSDGAAIEAGKSPTSPRAGSGDAGVGGSEALPAATDGSRSTAGRDERREDGAGGSGSTTSPTAPLAEDVPPGLAAGTDPPGGGYGSTAAKHHGRPEALPQASEHGQRTAAGHKPAHAGAPPTRGGAKGRGKGTAKGGSGGGGPASAPSKTKPPPPAKSPPPPPHSLSPPPAEKSAPPAPPDQGSGQAPEP
jgi:RNA polymerase sigma factor (sigma-70 family)